jgi:hypothetical protein
MNGAHETIKNNRPGSFIKVFIHERYCKIRGGTQIISGKKLNFKTLAFILGDGEILTVVGRSLLN